jgi:cytochrome c oxidase cbb3-type subunit 3
MCGPRSARTASPRPPATSGTGRCANTSSRCRAGGWRCSTRPSCSRSATCSCSPRKGALNWTSAAQLKTEVASADARFGPIFEAYLKEDLVRVAADGRAHQIGERIFLNTCSQCHGSDARGGRGFPDLTREEKIWGGTPEAIETTITGGREALMPPMAAALGSAEDVLNVANYVRSLSHSPHDPARAALGQAKFIVCSACHGPEGKGNPQIGAPNIGNAVLRYGSSVDSVVDAIEHGHHGVMPAWKDVLTPAQIHLVAAYVYSLSHPPAAPTAMQASQ